jgi:ribonuclease J
MTRTKTEIHLHPLTVTVHQGGHEIGGNLVSIRHEDGSTLILDLGLPLFDGAEDRPFPMRMEDLVQDKAGALKSLRAMGVAPEGLGIFVDEEPRPDTAVCISHAHADHWGLLPLLRPGTSVLASAETRGLIESQCAWKKIPLPTLEWFELDGDSAISVGKLNLESHCVDHSVPGALAFSIEGGGIRVIYTGDLRFASLKQVHTLVDEMKRHPDLLLCEGTSRLLKNPVTGPSIRVLGL